MGATIYWRRVAEEDLAEAYRFIGDDSPDAAERLLHAVETATHFLLEMPNAGTPREYAEVRLRRLRSWAISGFEAFLLFYRPVDDGIEVVRVLHSARDLPAAFGEAE